MPRAPQLQHRPHGASRSAFYCASSFAAPALWLLLAPAAVSWVSDQRWEPGSCPRGLQAAQAPAGLANSWALSCGWRQALPNRRRQCGWERWCRQQRRRPTRLYSQHLHCRAGAGPHCCCGLPLFPDCLKPDPRSLEPWIVCQAVPQRARRCCTTIPPPPPPLQRAPPLPCQGQQSLHAHQHCC